MTALRQKMIDQMTLRGFSPRTHRSYLEAVNGLARYYHRAPDQLSRKQIQDYLLYLERERHLSWSSRNVAVSAFRFLYGQTLGWDKEAIAIPRRQKETRLPEVLSPREVFRLVAAVANLKHRTLLMTAYAAGPRVSELLHLRVSDVDSARMTIRIEQGKGRKDRYTILSPGLLEQLRDYWKAFRPTSWLFPGKTPDKPLDISAAQKVYNIAKLRTGIHKGRGIHTLRHCFATHLLEAGVDLATIQSLMGHNDINTTMRYLKIRRHRFDPGPDPLDLLALPPQTPGQ